MKRNLCVCVCVCEWVLEGHAGLQRTGRPQLHCPQWLGHRLGLLWCWMVCLSKEPISSVIFDTAPRYCILDSFVDCESYFISSKGFFPTVVDKMVIWIKFTHSSTFLVYWFLKCHCSPLPPPVWPLQFTLIHGTKILGFYAIPFFTALDFTFTTRHVHNWVSFLLWPRCFILFEAVSNCSLQFSSSILVTFQAGWPIFWCHIFLQFHTVHGVLMARILEWVAVSFS